MRSRLTKEDSRQSGIRANRSIVSLVEGPPMNYVSRFFQDDSAATAVEYAVMLALILLTCIGAITTFGTGQGSKWTVIDNKLDAAGF